jgi:hypothetical protein
MKPVTDSLKEFSLDTVESKLAVLFARKTRTAPPASFQVNIGSIGVDTPNLPDFMKQAMEYDKANTFELECKA